MKEQELVNQGYRKYSGEQIDVFYSAEICEHAGKCVQGSIEVFNPKQKPWIQPDAKSVEEVAAIIHTCPSGALQYLLRDE